MRKTYKNPFYDYGVKLDSVKEMIDYVGIEYSNNIAYRYKAHNEIVVKRYSDVLKDVKRTSQALMQQKFEKKHIAVIGKTSYEWIIAYLSVMYAGMVIVPLDPQLKMEELLEQIKRADVECVFMDAKYVSSFKDSGIGKIVYMGEAKRVKIEETPDCVSMERFGNDSSSQVQEVVIEPEKLSAIVFTSGTTGKSKGVMLSQKNLISDVMSAKRILGLDEMDSTLSILPLYHTYEMTCDILLMLYFGACVNLNDSLKYLNRNLNVFTPTTLFAVPMVVEEFYRKIMDNVKENKKERTFKILMGISSVLRKMNIPLCKRIFRNVRQQFGGKLNLIVCGGACLEQHYIDFFDNLGINVVHGYGITECSPLLSANPDDCKKRFSVGPYVSCCEVKIKKHDDYDNINGYVVGDIMAKGDNVMLGYYKDEEATKEAFEGEWFLTGDIGYMDEHNYLYITGRSKNMIILDNGKNVSPEELEGKFVNSGIVKEVMVTTKTVRNTKQIHAVVYPDYTYAKQYGIDDIHQYLETELNEINRSLPAFKQITSFELREEEFEKTSTKKIKRYNIQ